MHQATMLLYPCLVPASFQPRPLPGQITLHPLASLVSPQFGFIAWLAALTTTLLGLRYEHMAKGMFTPMLQAAVAGMAGVMATLSFVGPPKAKAA